MQSSSNTEPPSLGGCLAFKTNTRDDGKRWLRDTKYVELADMRRFLGSHGQTISAGDQV